ncbi:flippase-like domain-containing protein [Labilibaculum sp. DW002]|uniref:Flippase-like domain-containing protein n=1 Tax=Paralabilibaculum antarcticum TaxID=2912572 RepID=A0ABT5VQ67_9BACT|nr:lysylphosphatidylglycerol synthase transmembrane domain-containing protein [Labilibaculum sp. DW002]MDE5416399.1 flippase-like domain-containing protein [Labilibaculum sp. DW002]
MGSKIKSIVQNSLGLIIGSVFLFLTLREKPMGPVWESLANADYFFILLSFVCLFIVFYLRALRWKLLIEESGETPKSDKVLTSILIGYFVNSFTPKFGEIIRCTSLQKTTKVPVAVSMGSMMAERAYDLLILGLGVFTIFWIELDRLQVIIDSTIGGISHIYGYRYLYVFPIAFVVLLLLFLISLRRLKKSERRIVKKPIEFLQSMFLSLKQGLLLKKRIQFIILTLLIWIFLVLLNYIYLLCLPETSSYSIGFALIILFIGGIGWALPSPGGIGTTHFFLLQLFLAYQLDPNAGISFGILSNGLTFIGTIILGGYGYFRYWVEIKAKNKIKTS